MKAGILERKMGVIIWRLTKGNRTVINNSRMSIFSTGTQEFRQNDSALWRC